jgi:diguanylate cyclase (GGDEF)-like protein/PAS domain S-box-containing protein
MHLKLFQWRSLKTRVTLLTLAIFLISVWALALSASRMLREDLQLRIGEQQLATVSLLAAHIDDELRVRLSALEKAAGNVTPAILANGVALQGLLAQRPVLQVLFSGGVWVTKMDGVAIAEFPATADRLGLSFMDRDHISSALKEGKSTVGRPIMGRALHAPVVGMAAPIRDHQGRVIGALVGVINLGQPNFLDKITQSHYGKSGGYLLVAPQHHLFVTATDQSRVMQATPAAGLNAMHDRYMQGYEGFGTALSSRGVEELSAAKGIPSAGWFIVASLPSAEAFAMIDTLQQRLLLATLVLTLLAGGLTWWTTSWMLRRQLAPMLAAANALALSDISQPPRPLPIARQDEIGQLINGFNQLVDTLAQREVLHRRIMDTASVAIFLIDMQGRITQANQPMATMFGWPLASLEGMEYVALVHPDERDEGRRRMLALLGSEVDSVDLDRLYRRADQTEFWGRLTGRQFFDANGQKLGLVGVIADITERKRIQKYERFRSHILELLAGEVPLDNILEALVLGVEEVNPAMLCSIMLLGAKTGRLAKGIAPSLPDFYNTALEGLEIGIGMGSCGTSAFTGQRVIVEDVAVHPYWAPYKDLAAQAGLGACWSQPIRSASGQVLGTFAIYHRQAHAPSGTDLDIIEQSARLASIAIERKHSEEKLQLAANVFSHAQEGILITTLDGTIIDVNDAFSRITGYSRAEMLGQNPRVLRSGRQDKDFYTALYRDLAEKGHWHGEIWNRRKGGELYAQSQTISLVKDAQGQAQHYVAMFSDITAVKEHQNHLEHIAHFDALTHLPNRVLLADRLQQGMAQALRRDQPLAVAFLDLDGFKTINDHYGHDAGDQLLIALSARMKQALRDSDTLARMGGDEFVAVLTDLPDVAASLQMINRLLVAAAQPIQAGDHLLQVSASLGVTFYPQPGEVNADQLLRQADQAMYQAKLAGKNRYHVFDAAHDSSLRGHHESLEHIRQAMDAREFILYYQPKVNMRTGAVIGAEALIRWQHPQRGLLAPAVFLPVIEDHPLAVEIGEWVIDTALTQMETWRAQGLTIPVSVNIGARQLQQSNFVERLRELLAAHPQIGPDWLELEVLETSALEDLARVSQIIADCRRIGVHFALDDFGTGYSSLTYLKRLPATLLKIDQSFVRDMLDDPDDLAILEGVIGLSRAFRRDVIAEGVETVEHGAMLLRLGCDLAQGYGIARPMPAHALPAWTQTWQPDPGWSALKSVQREDFPLLFASVEHSAWSKAMENFLRGIEEAPPTLDPTQCHFGQWLANEGMARHGTEPAFALVETLHRQAHDLAGELCDLHIDVGPSAALARIDELHVIRDALLDQLKGLLPDST